MRHFTAATDTDFLQASCSSGKSVSFSVTTSINCHLKERTAFNCQLVRITSPFFLTEQNLLPFKTVDFMKSVWQTAYYVPGVSDVSRELD